MNDKMFNELLASVNEADLILKGEKKPSRTFEYPEEESNCLSISGSKESETKRAKQPL